MPTSKRKPHMPIPNTMPSFFSNYLRGSISGKDRDQYLPLMSNWLKLHRFVRSLKPEFRNLRTLCILMALEYVRPEGPRMDIVVRLHGKFTKLRYEVERVALGVQNK